MTAIKYKIKRGDKVQVIAGKDKGRQGEVLKILVADNKVVVSGINMISKNQRPSMNSAGGIIRKEAPLHRSNVALIDPQSGNITKVGYKITENGKKRYAKKSGELID
jgi:large subunit ribosomal protein L24